MSNRLAVGILRLPAVIQKIGMVWAVAYDQLNPKSPRYDTTFPKKQVFGVRSVGWIEAEVNEWLSQRCKLI